MFFSIRFQLLFLCFFSAFLISCSTDDTSDNKEKYSIQTDAKEEDLVGVWSIYVVEIDEFVQDVPVNFEECGRDFFIYKADGKYEEFLFQESSSCLPSLNQFNWKLDNGILTLSTIDLSESEQIKVNSLNENTFIFTVSIDLNGDGKRETYTLTAFRYIPPNEMDLYTDSFQRKEEDPFAGHIEFDWDMYTGYNNFIKYEIYRDSSADCNINSSELVKTIENVNETNFIDENPPVKEGLCYFLKIYTDKGLLGQSDPRFVPTEFIIPNNVKILNNSSTDDSVTISWEKYSGYYFSHYEIRVQDQDQNSSPNIETIKIIEDINVTSYTDIEPPYVNNPIYTIYVHNIFGNISPLNRDENMVKTNFIRPELLSFDYIKFLSFDSDEQVLFFYAVNPDNSRRLIKYDYINQNVLTEGFKLPTVETDVEMKLINSDNGKELILEQGGDYWVYYASDLTFKYELKPGFGLRDSFDYIDNGIWVFSNNDNVFTYKRNGSEMIKIDEEPHFSDHQGGMNYEITKIDNSNVLLSHNNEGRSIHYAIDENGYFTNLGVKEIPLLATYNSDVSVNSVASLLLNKKRNTVYSSTNFLEIDKYTSPNVTSNFNRAGSKIFGIDKQEVVTGVFEGHKKEIIIYDLNKKSVESKLTKGYPLYIAEDKQGNIVSLSSGFPRDEYFDIHNNNVPDMFVEVFK